MYSSTRPRNWKLLIFGAVVGLVYGLLIRVGAQMQIRGWTSMMSMAFLVLVPVAMGFVTVFVVELREPQPVWIWLLLPWVPVIGGALATIVALWEDSSASSCCSPSHWSARASGEFSPD